MLKNKVAIVTGGASGNGRAISEAFVQQGAKVIVADIQESAREGGEPTADVINAHTPGAAKFMQGDVSQISYLESLVAAAEEWGGLDIMVNNAGILQKEPILEATEETFHRMVDINVKSVFYRRYAGNRWFLSLQFIERCGAIVNLFTGR